MVRLDKFLCDSALGSRSQVKVILKAGRVTVDGTVVRDGSVKIDPAAQKICCDGAVMGGMRMAVVMLNKTAGFVTATSDDCQKTVMELLPKEFLDLDVKPVGRLDKETEGLLLFTNDGDLAHRLISPRYRVPKIYYARHEGQATEEDVQAFAQGLTLRDGTVCLPAVLQPLGPGESLVTVYEGKYHQVRRMLASRAMPVDYLERRQEGELSLGELPRGQARLLTQEEVAILTKEIR